jgi:hypothetical protein
LIYKHVPFWWARNSWSTDWNPTGGLEKGNDKTEMACCVKIAMYPFNKVAQFDIPIDEHEQDYTIPVIDTGLEELYLPKQEITQNHTKLRRTTIIRKHTLIYRILPNT